MQVWVTGLSKTQGKCRFERTRPSKTQGKCWFGGTGLPKTQGKCWFGGTRPLKTHGGPCVRPRRGGGSSPPSDCQRASSPPSDCERAAAWCRSRLARPSVCACVRSRRPLVSQALGVEAAWFRSRLVHPSVCVCVSVRPRPSWFRSGWLSQPLGFAQAHRHRRVSEPPPPHSYPRLRGLTYIYIYIHIIVMYTCVRRPGLCLSNYGTMPRW